MLALVNSFAGQDARDVFESPAGSVHVFAVCALLFIQLLGRHMYEASSQDHWPEQIRGPDWPIFASGNAVTEKLLKRYAMAP